MFISKKLVKFSIFVLFCLARSNIVKADKHYDDILYYYFHASGTVYCTTAEPMELNRTDPVPFIVPPPLANIKVEIGEELWVNEDGGCDYDDEDCDYNVPNQDMPELILEETHTNKMGQFNVSGDTSNKYNQKQKPYLLITHKCQQENGGEPSLKEECSYISRIALEKGQKHLKGGEIFIENIGIFLGLNVAKINGTKVEMKTELKCNETIFDNSL